MKSKARNPATLAGYLRALPRGWDSLPLWAQINVTWKCNLSCGYCTEYDNAKGNVPFADVVARIDKCKELGVKHTDLIGGEPLLHPDIIPLMQHVLKQGMTTGMTTNGFLLTKEKLDELIDMGFRPRRARPSRSRPCVPRSKWSPSAVYGSTSRP
jgi:sulfatase maturation enzyme AslB (radical SAM superfamily)